MERRRPRGVLSASAWSLAHVRGIEIGVDRSWILIFGLITWSLAGRFGAEHADWAAAQRWSAAVLASLLFFASIVLHELGHSLTALRLGVGVRSITLFLFGGVAQLESEPRRPRDEVLIAVAGPLVSVGIGVVLLGAAAALPDGPGLFEMLRGVCSWLGTINLVLAAFNVLPGFPLDGGRVLRGIVWATTGSFEKATRIAAASGSLLAYGLMGLGALAALGGSLLGGLWLAFIGWFLLSTARLTVAQATLEALLTGFRNADVMEDVDDRCLEGRESVQDVVEAAVLNRGVRTLYVVGADRSLRGIVTLADLAGVPAADRAHTRVEQVMTPGERIATGDPDATTWSAFLQMAEREVNQLPVVERGRLLGAVTRQRLMAIAQASAALGQG